ncbi:MAG: hypothetical protein ABL918_09565 [Chakrabartia sp.]
MPMSVAKGKVDRRFQIVGRKHFPLDEQITACVEGGVHFPPVKTKTVLRGGPL